MNAGAVCQEPFLTIGLALGFFAVAAHVSKQSHRQNRRRAVARRKRPAAPRARVETDRRARRNRARKTGSRRQTRIHHRRPLRHDRAVFVLYAAGAKAALKSEPLVYCVDSDEPQNQFYFWPEYNYRAHRKGQNAIYVTELDPYPLERGWLWKWLKHQPVNYAEIPPPFPKPPRMLKEFESVTDLGEHEIKLGDRVFRRRASLGVLRFEMNFKPRNTRMTRKTGKA